MPKKPLYFGDPNATMTICAKKMRRHLPKDVVFTISRSEDIVTVKNPEGVTVTPMCKHCQQYPLIAEEGSDEATPPALETA